MATIFYEKRDTARAKRNELIARGAVPTDVKLVDRGAQVAAKGTPRAATYRWGVQLVGDAANTVKRVVGAMSALYG